MEDWPSTPRYPRVAEMDEGKAVGLNTYGFIFGGKWLLLHFFYSKCIDSDGDYQARPFSFIFFVSLEELSPFYAAVSHSQLRHPSKISVTM